MIEENKDWYKFEGATDGEINQLINAVDFELPQKYLELLRFSNGGEGPLLVQPFNFVLDSINDAISMLSVEHYQISSPDHFIFGGNGGGELIAINVKTGESVSIDATNANLEEGSLLVAKCFEDFVKYIGVESEQA